MTQSATIPEQKSSQDTRGKTRKGAGRHPGHRVASQGPARRGLSVRRGAPSLPGPLSRGAAENQRPFPVQPCARSQHLLLSQFGAGPNALPGPDPSAARPTQSSRSWHPPPGVQESGLRNPQLTGSRSTELVFPAVCFRGRCYPSRAPRGAQEMVRCADGAGLGRERPRRRSESRRRSFPATTTVLASSTLHGLRRAVSLSHPGRC